MAEQRPDEILGKTTEALGAVLDLLVTQQQGDMHMVRPEHLYSLLEILHQRLELASAGFESLCRRVPPR